MSLALGMTPLGERHFVAEADVPGPVSISCKMFATVDDLKDGEIFSLAEENDDKVGRIVFGTRPNPVKYYYEDWSNGHEEPAGPMTWLIAGWDEAENSGKPGLVLYSEKPMVSSRSLDGTSDSRFQGKYKHEDGYPLATTDAEGNNIGFDESWGSYEGDNPTKVYAVHWGASNARAQLDVLFTGNNWFTEGEKARMLLSRITTTDTKNSVDYTTDDTLYALRLKAAEFNYLNNTAVTAGEADSIVIDNAYWGNRSWLRSPHPHQNDDVLLALPAEYVGLLYVDNDPPALAAACKINLESVIFASAALAAQPAEGFSQIDPNAPMYLRLDGSTELSGASVAADSIKLTYTAPAGSHLMVIATSDDGTTYQFSHSIDTDVFGETLDLADYAGNLEGKTITAKAWIEKDADGQLAYATSPIDFSGTMVKVEEPETPGDDSADVPETSTNPDASAENSSGNNYPDWGEREIHAGIIHYVNREGMTSVEISAENTDANGIVWLREESDGTAAWYGIDNSADTFAAGSRFYVQWLNTTEHPEAFADIDEETQHQVEENRGWLFKIGVIAPDGTRYSTLGNPVNVYVQIGDDWDETDLQGFYIQQGADESVEVSYVEGMAYPEGTDKFGVMQLNHFSPYFIYDKDTEKDQNALNAVKTGDQLTYITISGLGLVMTLALGLMLKSKISRKNSDE